MTAQRIDPEQAHEAVESGALLVCAYDDEEKCRQNLLEGALTLAQARAMQIPRDRPIVFYCA